MLLDQALLGLVERPDEILASLARGVLEAVQAGGARPADFLDLFTADIGEATVVTLYLTPSLNTRLLPKLNKELKPGTRVVSHRFEMRNALGMEYPPAQKLLVDGNNIYLWTAPIE
jgi:hypothetical protein